MIDPSGAHVFGVRPGADFPQTLVAGLRARLAGHPAEAIARVEVYVNSGRMLRAVREAFLTADPGFLPRLRLVSEAGNDPTLIDLPDAVPPLRRRLELARLVGRLIESQPDLAPRAATYDLADSLANLMEEMQHEDVKPGVLAAIDVSEHSAHWRRTRDFLTLIAPFFSTPDAPDAATRQRPAIEALDARWRTAPPTHPVIVAGSTGSRGTTALLMQAVARLPRGALVLPGFDDCLPLAVWEGLTDARTGEDHPQFRYRRLMTTLGIDPSDIQPWFMEGRSNKALNNLISLSLRPAPVTDQWLNDGQDLGDLVDLTCHIRLIEAPDPRREAVAIALILRKAVEEGRAVALISADRMLTRRVTAALDIWGILPDDSAGRPLALSAPGRLLRHVANLFGQKLTAESLLVLLKHPLVATGATRGDHLRWTRDLELDLRRKGPAFPSVDDLRAWATKQRDPGAAIWADWLAETLGGLEDIGSRSLTDHVTHHLSATEALAQGPNGTASGALWDRDAGQVALATMQSLQTEAPHGGDLGCAQYASLLAAILAREEVREAVQAHPLIRVLGPREARECRADLVVLAGLNDGIWPQLPPPDPWLNRRMRLQAGLLLPERQIGLSAHDYQQAVAAPEVYLTRAIRDAEAETVASRWINRLTNLLSGLPAQRGPDALAAMRTRGQVWLDLALAADRPEAIVSPAHRPAPRPPVAVRPRELAVTGIRTLIRDPYAIYARRILHLRPLDPLRPSPDALARGSAIHAILERFVQERDDEETPQMARARLLAISETVLAELVPWPSARLMWRARLERAASAFLAREAEEEGQPVIIESKGGVTLPDLGFRLTAKPDRIDLLPDGRLHILDYKTGAPPTEKQQKAFDKQLLLEAAMAERGGFEALGPREVARITYVGLNTAARVISTEITPELTQEVWDGLRRLIAQYLTDSQGYTARRAVFDTRFAGDYDHLARFGEWEMTDEPLPETVG